MSQKNDKAPKFGYGTQFIASEDSVQNPSDVDLTLSGKTDAVITDKEVLAPLPNTTGLNIHSPPKKCYTSQNHQPNLMQDRRKVHNIRLYIVKGLCYEYRKIKLHLD